MHFDKETAKRVETTYKTPDIVRQRKFTRDLLALTEGERVLDIGTGPGLLAAEMAALVGPRGIIEGIDSSSDMLAVAEQHCADYSHVRLQEANATDLPFPECNFDVVVSVQVYEYVEDIEAALAELRRVLRPGGRALIIDTDWDSLVINTENRERMDRILCAWDSHAAHRDLPRKLMLLLDKAGLSVKQIAGYPIINNNANIDTYSHGWLKSVHRYVDGHRGISGEEARAWLDELQTLERCGAFFMGLCRFAFVAHKPT